MKKSQVLAEISSLKGIQKVSKIIDLILSIDNFQADTLSKLDPCPDNLEGTLLDYLYVDLDYQRRLSLNQIINNLLDSGGFDKSAAGHIDVAKRTDGKLFVWDGLHRVIMAALCGITKMPISTFIHSTSDSIGKQQEKEARLFEKRNGKHKKVKAEEVFKAQICSKNNDALELLELMKKSKLDIENLNPDPEAYDIGGFATFQNQYKNYEPRYIIDASDLVKSSFPKVKNCSVNMLFGLASLLKANNDDQAVQTLGLTTIRDALKTICEYKTQKFFMQNLIHGKPAQSVARNIIKHGLGNCYNDDGNEVKSLLKTLNLNEEELDEMDYYDDL